MVLVDRDGEMRALADPLMCGLGSEILVLAASIAFGLEKSYFPA